MNQKFLIVEGTGIGKDGIAVIHADIEDIASMLVKYSEVPYLEISTLEDYPLLNSRYGYVDRCYDQPFMHELLPLLAPMQLGEKQPKEFREYHSYEELPKMGELPPDWSCSTGHGIFNLML